MLPDLLRPGLRIVFCGTAASRESARVGAYYARAGNRFWGALHEAGFTPCRMRPAEYRLLARLGIGLTDLAKRASGSDQELRPEDFDPARFAAGIRRWRPGAVAFTSKAAAAVFLGRPEGSMAFGAQAAAAAPDFPPLFVLPSPSPRNGHWAGQRHHWAEAARALGYPAPAPPVAA